MRLTWFFRFLPLAIITSSVIFINPFESFLIGVVRSLAFQAMFGYLILGFGFFLFKKYRIGLSSVFTSIILFIFLMPYIKTQDETQQVNADLRVAHFNVLRHNDHKKEMISQALFSEADFISFQEVNNDWKILFDKWLKPHYPYSKVVSRETCCFGIAVFSKYPLENIEVHYWEELPNISGDIQIKDSSIHFVTTHTNSPTTPWSYYKRNRHINKVAEYIQQFEGPILAMGDYNTVPWDKPLRDFRNNTKLMDSRKGYHATYPTKLGPAGVPIDYIFHSDEFNCLRFDTISRSSSDHLGIIGEYSFNKKKNRS